MSNKALRKPRTPGKNNEVHHPNHYTSHPSGIECIQVTEHMSFCVGNAIKYLWRFELKHGITDLEKARWYIDREIQRKTPATKRKTSSSK